MMKSSRSFPSAFPLLLLLGLILVFLHKMVFSNLILARGDTFLYFYPYWEAAAEALRAGRVPLWNPNLFMGAPFIANSQAGFFYPLNWPLWLLLSTPVAVKVTIVLHLAIAGLGTYWAGRRAVGLSRPGALLAALLFALGGYLTAQVEHVNQLQGLAWLPWLLGSAEWGLRNAEWHDRLRAGLVLGLLFGLQVTAGHMQTVFISGMGVMVWLAVAALWRDAEGARRRDRGIAGIFRGRLGSLRVPVLLLFFGGGVALLLAAVQVLPTLELAGLSGREGGLPLNEALSFSLHPLLLGRALLPGYGQSLFSEYVAFLPLTALLLAVIGGWQVFRGNARPGVLPALLLAAVGFIFALGKFNPLYVGLAHVPGFDLFRAPARWLALYALGMALLAGAGWDVIAECRMRNAEWRQNVTRPGRVGVLLLLLIIAWSLVSVPLAQFIPLGPEAPATYPSLPTIAGWLVELTVAFILLRSFTPTSAHPFPRSPLPPYMLHLYIAAVLFLAARALPYNHLTAPDAYASLRPPIARLQALSDCDPPLVSCPSPPGRVLSLSDIFFDLGDQAEIEAIYGDQLPPDAIYDFTIASKHKEVLSPNLPLVYGLNSVDGFDGGILPLRAYTALMRLVLPDGVTTSDGRLREYLDALPAGRWLDLFNARYLITDRVSGNEWRDEVLFDVQHPLTLAPGTVVPVGHVPDYEATELWLLAEGTTGQVLLGWGNRDGGAFVPEPVADDLWRVTFPYPLTLDSIVLRAPETGAARVRGMALVDSRDDTFFALLPGRVRQIFAGDVTIYENLDVLPRAFMVHNWRWVPDVAASVGVMAADRFDPHTEAVLVGVGEDVVLEDVVPGRVDVIRYEPERATVRTDSAYDGLLLLTDANYPGWQATLDGEPAPILQADGLFRGVMVPAGAHEVVFAFASNSFRSGRGISLIALALWLVAFGILVLPRHKSD